MDFIVYLARILLNYDEDVGSRIAMSQGGEERATASRQASATWWKEPGIARALLNLTVPCFSEGRGRASSGGHLGSISGGEPPKNEACSQAARCLCRRCSMGLIPKFLKGGTMNPAVPKLPLSLRGMRAYRRVG